MAKLFESFGKKKKRGRPKKKPVIENGKIAKEEPKIEVRERSFKNVGRSHFDLERFGVKDDPTKDRRWVAHERIEERKNNDGYTFVGGGKSSDGTVRTKGKMVLMERSRDRADESRIEKDLRTARQSSATKEDLGQRVEKLSEKYGINLHKYVKN